MNLRSNALQTTLLLLVAGASAAPQYEDATLSRSEKTTDNHTTHQSQSSDVPLPYNPPPCSPEQALHSPSQRCYFIGKQGPCNEYERWFAKSANDTEGECSCLTLNQDCDNLINRPIARSSKDQRCYPVYSKANCQDPNEWFTFLPKSFTVGHCTLNPCTNMSLTGTVQLNETMIIRILGFSAYTLNYTFSDEDLQPLKPFWFLHRNKCVQSFTVGTCKTAGNDKPHSLMFRGTKPIPECRDASVSYSQCPFLYTLALPQRENQCPSGYKKLGKECSYEVTIVSEDYED